MTEVNGKASSFSGTREAAGFEELVSRQLPPVGYCPRCGTSFFSVGAFVQEYWVAAETIHFCWCPACLWRGEIKAVDRVYGVEPAEDEPYPSALPVTGGD
jgi:hypothetical protein